MAYIRKVAFVVLLIAAIDFAGRQGWLPEEQPATTGYPDTSVAAATAVQTATGTRQDPFATAFAQQRSNLQLQGAGTVVRVLSDDNNGSRHQRFIVRFGSGQTLLVAHNIDLAPRVAGLDSGDTVEFYGEYEWNPEGGVMHWTHDDPQGSHPGGWIRHEGRTYR